MPKADDDFGFFYGAEAGFIYFRDDIGSVLGGVNFLTDFGAFITLAGNLNLEARLKYNFIRLNSVVLSGQDGSFAEPLTQGDFGFTVGFKYLLM